MNHIRQALHNACRHYAKEAHRKWSRANQYAEQAIHHAATGRQIERIQAQILRDECFAQFWVHDQMAKRARSMMK
jgi:hypothetical protein